MYDSSFGSMKVALSLAMMINISMLVGLTQRDNAHELLGDIRTMRKAAAEIKKYDPELQRWEREMRNVDYNAGKSAE